MRGKDKGLCPLSFEMHVPQTQYPDSILQDPPKTPKEGYRAPDMVTRPDRLIEANGRVFSSPKF